MMKTLLLGYAVFAAIGIIILYVAIKAADRKAEKQKWDTMRKDFTC
jgi:hypothetical protein